MGSRDFGFLSLRPPLIAYQSNGLPVAPNNILVTSSNGAAQFSNSINISSANISSANINYISSNNISVSTLNTNILSSNIQYASSINASSIDTNYLEATKAYISGPTNGYLDATLTVNNTISIVGSTPPDSQLLLHNGNSRLGTSGSYAGLFLQAKYPESIQFSDTYVTTGGVYAAIGPGSSGFNGTMTVASTLTCSTLNTNRISTSNITTNYLSTFKYIKMFDPNNSTNSIEVTCSSSALTVNGHVVATDATISTVSTVFWNDDISGGGIYNKNAGFSGNNYYQVGVGTAGNNLNATFDIRYSNSSGPGNVFNASTANGQRLTMDSNGIVTITSSLNVNNKLNISTNNQNGAIRLFTETGNSFIESGSTFASGSANSLMFTNINNSNITPLLTLDFVNKRAGINNDTPQFTFDVNGNARASGFVSTNTINMNDGLININNGRINNLSSVVNDSGAPLNFDNTNILIANGNLVLPTPSYYISTNNINMNNGVLNMDAGGGDQGQISGLSTINGRQFDTNNDIYWTSTTANGIRNSNSGNVSINTLLSTNQINMNNGTINPGGSLLTIGGPLYVSSFSTNIANANLKLFNGNGAIVTNPGFDGIYIESGNNQPIYLCSTNNVKNYAQFGPTTNNLNLNTLINGTLRLVSSSAASPALFFNSDTDTGLYGISDGEMGISANGQQRMFITNNNIDLTPSANEPVNIITTSPSNNTTLQIINNSNISSVTKLSMQSDDISYGLYTTNTQGGIDGTIASTFQIYSYYPAGNKNVLTIYPDGNTNINGNLNVAGPAISQVATTTIIGNPGDSYSSWAQYIGRYCFVNGVNLTLPITSPPTNFNGSIIVIRNISGGTTIAVTNSNGGASILPGKTTSYVYTNSVTAGWYAL